MKKVILVAMVAVSMLFAFTACDNSVPTYKNADYITVSQNTPFIEGQAFNAANFDVTIHYTDGSTSVVNGNGLVKATAWGTSKTVTAVINTDLSATFEANVIALDDCEVVVTLADDTTTPIKPTAAAGESRTVNIDVESVSYTAEGVTYEATASEYNAYASVNADQLKVADSYTVEATVYKGDNSTGTKVATVEATVEVLPAADTSKHIVGFEVLYDVDSAAGEESDVEDATSLSNLWIGDKVTARLVQVVEQNGKTSYEDITSGYQTANLTTGLSFTQGKATVTVGKTNYTGNAYYYNKDLSSSTQAKNISIPAGASTVTGTPSVTADAEKYPVAGTVLAGNSDLSGYVKVTGLTNTDSEIKDVDFSIVVDPAMSFTIPASGSVDVYYFLTYNSYGEDVVVRNSVSIQAKAAEPTV